MACTVKTAIVFFVITSKSLIARMSRAALECFLTAAYSSVHIWRLTYKSPSLSPEKSKRAFRFQNWETTISVISNYPAAVTFCMDIGSLFLKVPTVFHKLSTHTAPLKHIHLWGSTQENGGEAGRENSRPRQLGKPLGLWKILRGYYLHCILYLTYCFSKGWAGILCWRESIHWTICLRLQKSDILPCNLVSKVTCNAQQVARQIADPHSTPHSNTFQHP